MKNENLAALTEVKPPMPEKTFLSGNKSALKQIAFCLFFPLSIIYYEVILNAFSNAGHLMFFTVLFFSFSVSTFLLFIGTLFGKKKITLILCEILISLTAVFFIAELLLYKSFATYFGIAMIGDNAANVAGGFGGNVIKMILSSLFVILLFAIPPLLFAILFKKEFIMPPVHKWTVKAAILLVVLPFHSAGMLSVYSQETMPVSGYEYYTSDYSFTAAAPRFGLLTSLRLDIKYDLFGIPEPEIGGDFITDMPGSINDLNQNNVPHSGNVSGSEVIEYQPNIDPKYDFDKIAKTSWSENAKEIAAYVAATQPTMKNEYTGLFEGKNLIFITAEAFNTFVMSEELTPTLWKMAHEGFVLTEYYQPSYYGGTSSGEYSNLCGLIPEGPQAMQNTARQDMSFTIGNHLLKKEYTGMAFHNGASSFYDRNKTHKRLGYEKWITYTTGLYDNYPVTNRYSDKQMMEASLPMYIDKEPFSIYYMTLSGHAEYSATECGGLGAANYDKVKDLPYSERLKYYIAQNLEFEYAMQYLTKTLEDAGKLDNTVFVISPDHYPYGLSWGKNGEKYIKEMLGKEKYDTNFDLMRTTGIIYCSSMESPVVVDKPTYSLDLYPTIMNLFGLTYDSRIFTGQDILSDSPGLVIFVNNSWISDLAYYNLGGTVTPRNGAVVSDEYVRQMTAYVKQKARMGRRIQLNDFFRIIEKASNGE